MADITISEEDLINLLREAITLADTNEYAYPTEMVKELLQRWLKDNG